ncbi:MAG TPA: hypothetical protein VF821_22635 [Lentzea sp.]
MNEPEQHTANQANGPNSGFVLQAGTVHGGIHVHGSPTPAPAPSAPAPPGDALGALVDALLETRSLSDEPSRRTVLSMLRREIAQAVPHHQGARIQVIDLVRTCLNYDGGLDDLLRVLREVEGDSIPVRRSAEAAQALTDENDAH